MPKQLANAPAEEAPAKVNLNAAERSRQSLREVYQSEEKVDRSISPLYAGYFGKVMQISINGITIAFPIDGSIHKIPRTFADELDARVAAINATINKATKMSDIKSNAEAYPGALQMF